MAKSESTKIEFGYFHDYESEQFAFYRIPKVLFTDEYFRNLSSDAKKIADGLEISVIEFLNIEIENEADLIAMLKKISPFFKWDGLLHVLEGEKFL